MNWERIRSSFERNGFTIRFFDAGEQALDYLAQQTAGKTVAFGGSKTLESLNAYDIIGQTAEVHWHWKGDGYMQTPDVYLTSANAVSETGEIVNIDGAGNRVSATLFGPKEVFFVCGINKITPDLMSAVARAQHIAAPRNAMRLCQAIPEKQTVCAACGGDHCYHCHGTASICRAMVIHQGPMLPQTRCEMILIGETLGY